MNRKIFSIVLASMFFTSCSEGQFLKDDSVGEIKNSSENALEDSNSNNSNKAENSNETSKDTENNEEVKKDGFNIVFYIDDSIYKSLQVKPGETPIVDDPVKEDDDTYRYEFLKWSPEITPACEDTFYFAIFNKIRKQYKINWVVNDQVYTQFYDKGSLPSYPNDVPTREPDGRTNYIFDGWNPEIKEVNANATYVAKFKELHRGYNVTFIIDGKLVQEGEYNYGVTPTFNGPTPFKEEDVGYTYSFRNWKPSIIPVDRDMIYVAEFDSHIKQYNIQFKVGDITTNHTLNYDATPKYSGGLIGAYNKVILNGKTYRFEGWQPRIRKVDSDQVYTAKLNEIKDKITVHFEPNGGSTNKDVVMTPFNTLPGDTKFSFSNPNHFINGFYTDDDDSFLGNSDLIWNHFFYYDTSIVPLYFGMYLSNSEIEFKAVGAPYGAYDYKGNPTYFTLPRFDYSNKGAGKCTSISNNPLVVGSGNNRDNLTFVVTDYLSSIGGPIPLHTISDLNKEATYKSCITKVGVSNTHKYLRGNGSTAIIEKDSDKLISANEYTVLTDDIKVIGNNAFSTTLVEKIYMPDSITEVNKEAFSYCKNLTSVVLSKKLTKLEEGTFRNTKSLSSIWIPSSISEIEANCFFNTKSSLKINYEGSQSQWSKIVSSDSNLSQFSVSYNISKPSGA